MERIIAEPRLSNALWHKNATDLKRWVDFVITKPDHEASLLWALENSPENIEFLEVLTPHLSISPQTWQAFDHALKWGKIDCVRHLLAFHLKFDPHDFSSICHGFLWSVIDKNDECIEMVRPYLNNKDLIAFAQDRKQSYWIDPKNSVFLEQFILSLETPDVQPLHRKPRL